ncbi:hypothetical protein GQ53DRAFT_754921 [Thozetella sp. PMI_491]|nr:hypothetical protein GQ53DRAFT_754921 [Thozetella sp. PMI_491]
MLFPADHSPLVKAWIVKRLENISDADADVLADYVIALLDHEGDLATVRKLCETEIPDFLKEDSAEFIDDVFRAIQHQAYLPGAAPLPPRPTLAAKQSAPAPALVHPPTGPATFLGPGLLYDDAPPSQVLPRQPSGGSRKRGYHDRDDVDTADSQGFGDQRGGTGRQIKQARRRGPRGRRDWDSPKEANGFRLHGSPYGPGFLQAAGQWQQPPGTGPSFDMSQAMGMYGGMPMPGGGSSMSLPMGPPRGPSQMRQQSFAMSPQRPSVNGEFDPNNVILPVNFTAVPGQTYQWNMKGDTRQQKNSSRKNRKADFSADGPVFDRKKSTLVIENIPPENLSEEEVRGFFSQFGNIVKVSMQPHKRLALVKYDNWGSANAAFQSPKVVFDNRFVKVFWHKGDDLSLAGGASGKRGKGGANGVHKNGNGGGASKQEQDIVDGAPEELEIDMEEFLRKQEEMQKAQEERKQKVEELERQKEDLQKKQKELFLKRQEEMARLNAKLALSAKRERENGAAASEGAEGLPAASKPSTQTEMLRAQLAALEREAIEMGIDPHADLDSEPSFSSSPWIQGDRGRGRGRGGFGHYRARGRAPRGGSRGGYVAGSNDATYAAFSLDNRPRKVAVIGVDLTVPESDESLRAYLFGVGEFTDIQTTPSKTEITFTDRKTAEKFMYGFHTRQIPGIDGKVDLAWISANGTLIKPAANTQSRPDSSGHLGSTVKVQQRETVGPRADTESDSAAAAASSGTDKDVSIVLDRPVDAGENGEQTEHGEQGYMDYDVADDNQWDIG